jgi:6-phosphogluconolactonase
MEKRTAFWKWCFFLFIGLTMSFVLIGCGDDDDSHHKSAKTSLTSFTANPATITLGQGTILAWIMVEGKNAGNITYNIDQGVGDVTGTSVAVTPTVTTTYTLTATWPGGTATKTATVTVKEFFSKFVYVANSGDGTVSGFTLDDETGALVSMGDPFNAGLGAMHAISDPEGKFLFVANNEDATISVFAIDIDGDTGALSEVDGSPFTTGDSPWCTTVSPDGKFVYVRCDDEIDGYSLDADTGVLTPLDGSPFDVPGESSDIIVHPSGRYLFTASSSTDLLYVFSIDAETGDLTGATNSPYTLTADGYDTIEPYGLSVNPTGEYVFAKGEIGPSTIFGFKLDINEGTLTAAEGSPYVDLPGDDSFHGLTFSPTLNVLYVIFYDDDTYDTAAYDIDLESGSLDPVAGSPYTFFPEPIEGETRGGDQIAVSRNGKWAFSTNYDGDLIAEMSIDSDTGGLTFVNTFAVGFEPESVTVVGMLIDLEE